MWRWLWIMLVLAGGVQAAPPQAQPKETPARVKGLLAALNDPDNAVVVRALAACGAKEVLGYPEIRERLRSFIGEQRFGDLLKAQDSDVRSAAVEALEKLGPDAKELAPALGKLLEAQDSYVRRAAAKVLGQLGPDAKELAPALGKLLEDKDSNVQSAAAEALGNLGPAAKEQAPALVKLLEDKDSNVQSAAQEALEKLGPDAKDQAPALVKLLEDKDSGVQRAAAALLVKLGPDAKAQAPALVKLMGDQDSDVRSAAAKVLGQLGPDAKDQAPALVKLLEDKDPHVRHEAAFALGNLGPDAKEAPALVKLLEDKEWYVRWTAAYALGQLGPAAKGQAPALVKLLEDKYSDVRSSAAVALGQLGPDAKAQAPALGKLLGDQNSDVRSAAAVALGQLGPEAKAQAPALVKLLEEDEDIDSDVRSAAAVALGKLNAHGKEQAPALGKLLEDKEWYVRRAAAEALGKLGPDAKDQAPALVKLLGDQDSGLQIAAAVALGKLGSDAKEQAPALVKLLEVRNRDIWEPAAEALGQLGPEAKDQAPALVKLLEDEYSIIREAAAMVLGKLGPEAKKQTPAIVKLLEDKGEESQGEVMKALRAVGGIAVEDTPRVVSSAIELLGGGGEDARNDAAEVLSSLAPLSLEHIAAILALAEKDSNSRDEWLLLAHVTGGGDTQVESILRWLVRRPREELPKTLDIREARETLHAFRDLWPFAQQSSVVLDDLAKQIAQVATLARGRWTSEDLELLQFHQNNLAANYSTDAQNVQSAIDSVNRRSAVQTFLWAWAGHIAFWLLLLFFYPRSPQVQAFFFWNPWVRTITGFWYVGALLTWVPLLRRRLLAPFARQLLADADLERFSAESYFPDSEVVIPPSSKRERLLTALPQLRGQVVLEGASGLGKSLFIKYLLRRSKHLAVFLPAERCRDGVLKAIQDKLEGQAQDAAFLQSIIYSGALDIYIDGLNEVTADTRASIVNFVERNFHGNILLATQRMEWTGHRPPRRAGTCCNRSRMSRCPSSWPAASPCWESRRCCEARST